MKIKKEKMRTFLLVIFLLNIFFTNVAQFQDISGFLEAINGDQVDQESRRPVEQFKDDHAFKEYEDKNKFNRVRKFVQHGHCLHLLPG